jgi:thioredoxin reductase (NADPH)
MVHDTDVVIIGAGPVGLFGVFQCGMLNLKCHVTDALDMVGGQCAALYPEKPLYDIPAYPSILGEDLVKRLSEQAAPFSPTYHLGQKVVAILPIEGEGGIKKWHVETCAGTHIHCRAIIIAAGVGAFGPNRPPLAHIQDYEDKSVFYFVKSKEAFRGKRVMIAGGGDSAVDWALSLVDVASHLSVVHRRPKFRAAPDSESKLNELAKAGRLELVIPYQLSQLEGEKGQLTAVIVQDMEGRSRRLETDILLPFYGLAMNLGPIGDWGLALERNHISIDPSSCATNMEGIFAIGDIATYKGKLKLILTGFAEAASAAHAIRHFIYPQEVLHFEYSTTRGVPGPLS